MAAIVNFIIKKPSSCQKKECFLEFKKHVLLEVTVMIEERKWCEDTWGTMESRNSHHRQAYLSQKSQPCVTCPGFWSPVTGMIRGRGLKGRLYAESQEV